jgi:hypothetical protein
MLFLQMSPDFSRRVFLLASAVPVLFFHMDVIRSIVNRPRADRVQVGVIPQGKDTYYCNASLQQQSCL